MPKQTQAWMDLPEPLDWEAFLRRHTPSVKTALLSTRIKFCDTTSGTTGSMPQLGPVLCKPQIIIIPSVHSPSCNKCRKGAFKYTSRVQVVR